MPSKAGGSSIADGQTNAAAWGKRAEWVDYHGPVDGETVGIAIFNHPSSFRYPTGWHVRTYGLFAANPFAEHSFAGKEAARPCRTRCRRARRSSCGTACSCTVATSKEGKVAEAFADYARLKK